MTSSLAISRRRRSSCLPFAPPRDPPGAGSSRIFSISFIADLEAQYNDGNFSERKHDRNSRTAPLSNCLRNNRWLLASKVGKINHKLTVMALGRCDHRQGRTSRPPAVTPSARKNVSRRQLGAIPVGALRESAPKVRGRIHSLDLSGVGCHEVLGLEESNRDVMGVLGCPNNTR